MTTKQCVFGAELYAVTLAVDFVCYKDSNFIIFLDSMCSLEGLNGFKLQLAVVLCKCVISMQSVYSVVLFFQIDIRSRTI